MKIEKKNIYLSRHFINENMKIEWHIKNAPNQYSQS